MVDLEDTTRNRDAGGLRPFEAVLIRLRPSEIAGLITLGAVLLQLYGGPTAGSLGAGVGLLVAGTAAYLADPRYLGPLLLACFPALGLGVQSVGAGALVPFPWVPANPTVELLVAGVAVSAPLVVLLAALARLCIDILLQRNTIRAVPPWMLILYLVALVPVALGAMEGRALGLNRWSQGFRGMLAIGGLFWGVALARRSPGPGPVAERIIRLAIIGSVLVLIGLMRDHLLFLTIGVAAAGLPYLLGRLQVGSLLIASATAFLGLVYFTLTTAAQVVLSLGAMAAARLPLPSLRYWITRIAVVTAVLISVGLIYAVYAFRTMNPMLFAAEVVTGQGIGNYAILKLVADRGPLWLAALQQITSPPWLVVPAGRPLIPGPFAFVSGTEQWAFGAHNAFLELVRNVGWLAGAVGVALMVSGVVSAARSLVAHRDLALQGVAAAFIGITVAAATTGNFLVQDVGFFVWMLGGLSMAVILHPDPEPQPNPEDRQSPVAFG